MTHNSFNFRKKPLQKLFSSRVFEDFLTESNHKLRKLCADLFKATFEVPLEPNSILLLEKLVMFFANFGVRAVFEF